MFSKSKGEKLRKRPKAADGTQPKPSLSQLGLLEIPNVSDLALGGMEENAEDDAALEAELLALTGGKKSYGAKKARKLVDPENLDKMVADCMNDDYEDDQIDEDDPDLLAELSALGPGEENEEPNDLSHSESPSIANSESTPSPEKPAPVIVRPSPLVAGSSVVNLLKERIQMYKEAEENAIAAGETARAKRFTRGLKTLNQMMKSVSSGKVVNEENIPPSVLLQSSRNNSARDLSEQQAETPDQTHFQLSQPSTIPQNIVFSPENSFVPVQNEADDKNCPPSESPPSVLNSPYSTVPVESPSPQNTCPETTSSKIVKSPRNSSEIPITRPSPLAPTNLPSSPLQPLSPALSSILNRQQEYKMAALNAKKKGDKESAIQLMKTSKQLEPLIQAVKEGQTVDLESLPPPPCDTASSHEVPNENGTKKPVVAKDTLVGTAEEIPKEPMPQETPSAPPNPSSVLEALEQRLTKYTEQRDKAKSEGNGRKERMNQRIIKQFQDAIKAHKAGKPIDLEDLPTPPGFPPFPTGGSGGGGGGGGEPTTTSALNVPEQKPNAQNTQNFKENQPRPVATVKPQVPVKPNVRKAPQSRVERQYSVLKRRQDQFKAAALEAKKKGEIEQAKEYLRNYKGFDQLIAATNGGLPVDMNTVPIPPQEKMDSESTSLDFEIVEEDDCIVPPETTEADVTLAFMKLEEDLIVQIKMCAHTREHFKALGDVASANRFEQLILHTKKDLDAVRVACKRGDKPPRFHYENRSFTMIQCNTDLNDSDCEVCIVRGINFNVSNPSDVDTCVKIEFPYPSDAPPQERTIVIRDTNNPEFNHKVTFSIDRKARALARVFKRHSVKCQVIAKGGWFHRDSVLGTVKVPLVPLENKCTFHESFDLVDERKKMVGGKLEVKIRVRNPILSKQLEKVTEKWVVIDGF